VVDTDPIKTNRDRFHGFRTDIVALNQHLPAQRAARTGVISKPAETVLLKQLRQRGFDPSTLDVSHISRGGGLYLLELFVTAAQQEALTGTTLLTALLDEADALGEMTTEAALSRLHRPVLMVSLWDNQDEGLNEWLSNGRHGILEMATATGKTVAGIAAIAECCGYLPDDPTHEPWSDDATIMIVAHSNAILKQWERELQEKLGLPMPAGETGEKATRLSFSGGTVEFYTAQSLLPRYDRDLARSLSDIPRSIRDPSDRPALPEHQVELLLEERRGLRFRADANARVAACFDHPGIVYDDLRRQCNAHLASE
jgi:hypothetical protein